MGFNATAFMAQRFQARTGTVPVPALAAWFDEGEEPVWGVSGLPYASIASAEEAEERAHQLEVASSAITKDQALAERIRAALNLTGNQPSQLIKRVHLLVDGSISPKIDEAAAVKLAETFPIEFMAITNKILELTGMGRLPVGKSPPSGETGASSSP